MIEIRYLQAESGANKFGTCNCCGKSSSEDPLMISVKFSYYGHGTTICLCDDCKKKLMEALLPANNSEIPNSSDTISRQAAIDRATKEHDFFRGAVTVSDKARRDELLNVMCWLGELPPAPPAQLEPDQNGDLWITVPDIDKVTRIFVQESKSKFCRIFYEEQPERIIHCKDCEWWTKQEHSPQGRCALSGMCPTGGWFCGNARMRGEQNE